MRVHQLTFAALAVAASLSLTACEDGATGQGGATPAPTASSSAAAGGSGSGGSDQEGSEQSGGKDSGQASAGSTGGSGTGAKAAKCRTDALEITATDSTVGGDTAGTVAVGLKNRGGKDCTLSAYAGVDLKTNAGPLSAKRTGEQAGPFVLKDGKTVYFGISYPLNSSGGSGVRIAGLVVTPPDETESVTLNWPGAATLPVTDGSGSPVEVGPIGSAGQGG
ncbi:MULTISPECIES: DUF4232 domain-containing protein [unclassified Streptomyces]|uniref:DUF4232 domain-containing protein n=1 Tax=unclassified Streptomyces TaxID=2593676 RepID=UPI00081E7654|nr:MULTISPECIES: DUF4232 domain-containing protein [unclassified Streptomyces]MYR93456.1 DUF4232 domain-containing protein [Streptomyces sp. SID4937]SCD53111.1 Protein of unknown function [Streptomyces sp. ScaeMP-e83]